MKKRVLPFLIAVLLLIGLTGCANPAASSTQDGKIQIVSTIFPSYDFARQIGGDNAQVTLLLPPGMESHSYEPTPQDIIKIQNCDLFIYTGGVSDTWVDNLLSSLDHPVRTIKMMDQVTALEEELVEGMTEEEPSSEEETEYDEHVWTSPKNAVLICQAIQKALMTIDPANEQTYQENGDRYVEALQALDDDFTRFFAGVSNKTLIFGDRFPLRYFAEAYGLTYYAAFPGCSSETEPSAATIAFLIDKVKSEGISHVFYIEFSNHLVADSIAEAAKVQTARFHSCHNVSSEEQKAGATYLSLMRQNLETLKGAMK